MPDPFPSWCSTPPPTTPTSPPMTGIRRSPLRHSARRITVWPSLVEPTLIMGYEPKTCIDVSSEHTPINCTSKRNSFNIEHNDFTTTVEASDNSDGFQQQAAASGSPQQVPASVVKLGADMWSSTKKLVRGVRVNRKCCRVFVERKKGPRSGKCADSVRKEKSPCLP